MAFKVIKSIELLFRRSLLQLLGYLFKRERAYNKNIDLNSCKFLFMRQDRIGDVLVSTPLFSILKKYYPNAIIDVLLSKSNFFVLNNEPLVNKRWIYKKNILSIISLIKSIRKEKYDFAIDLMDNPSTTATILSLFIKARWNVGIDKKNSYVYDITVPMLSRKETHIVDRLMQLLKPFGINIENEIPIIRYFTSESSKRMVNAFLISKNIINKELIGINISAGHKVRFWGVSNFRALIEKILDQYKASVPLILYKPEDEKYAFEIASTMPKCIITPRTNTFDEFAAFIEACSFLITPDTSAVHISAAFKIPCVVLYVQSNKELRIWDPYATDHEALITDKDDLKEINVDDVFNAFNRLYKRTQ